MKCPHCGAVSEVVETRATNAWTLRRRRECFNGHRFSTYEVQQAAYSRPRNEEVVGAIQNRQTLHERNKRIKRALAGGMSQKAAAIEFELSEATISIVARA